MSPLKCGLYVVATPIGNLGDITLRGIEVLRLVDRIACEDTRVTRKLLSHHSVKTKVTSYHDHNANSVRPVLIQEIKNGKTIALVCDAGMPLISDPGYKLVRDCIVAGLYVTVAPGASAGLSGLVLSGLPTDRFLFVGYLPSKTQPRRNTLEEISGISASMIFQEAPGRLVNSLKDMASAFGNRPAAVLRELTKLHEEVRRGSLNELWAHYADNIKPKGEIVIVVGPADETEKTSDKEIANILGERLKTLTVRDAVIEVATITKQSRKKIYMMAINLQTQLNPGNS